MTLSNQLTPSQQKVFNNFLEENKQPQFQIRLLNAMTMMPVLDQNNSRGSQPWFSSKSKKGEVTFASPEGDSVHFMVGKQVPRQVNGRTEYITEPEDIQFEASSHGSIFIPRNDHARLIRFLFSNECSNCLNPAHVPPLTGYDFELVQPDKTAEQIASDRMFVVTVQTAISKNTNDENRLVAQRLTQANPMLSFDYGDPNVLRVALLDIAADRPKEVFRASTDTLLKAHALVEQARDAKLIRFVHETREWMHEATGRVLLSTPTGDPTEVLSAWLVDSQGTDAMLALKKQVDDLVKPAKVKAPAKDEPIPEGMKRGKFGRLEPIEPVAETA